MPLSTRVKSLDRIRKFLAIELQVTHKTDRTGGVLDTTSLYVTDARFLVDPDTPAIYHSRLLPGYRRVRTTGTTSGTGALLGTGIGPGTEPGTLKFSVFAGEDCQGNSIRDWQDWQLKGAVVIVRMGAVHDELGAAIAFSDFDEVWYGYLVDVPKTGEDILRFGAVTPEGYRADSPLARKTYGGWGYGAELDNSATSPAGTADAWLSGTGTASFSPTSNAYSWSEAFSIGTQPSVQTFAGQIFQVAATAGGTNRRLDAYFNTSDQVVIRHHDGASSTEATFTGWDLGDVAAGSIIRVGVRYDGSATAYLYVNGVQVDSVAITRGVASEDTLVLGRLLAASRALDATIYEFWLGNTDLGDVEFRKRQSGPLRGDSANQSDLWTWAEFIEGGELYPGSTATDQRFEVDLTLGGTAVFVSSREGDHPDVSPRPRADSHPYALGSCFNVPVAPLERSKAIYEFDRTGDSAEVIAARVDGAEIQIGYGTATTITIGINTIQTPVDGIKEEGIAKIAIPRDDATGQQGTEIEIWGDAGSPSNDGTYEVRAVVQKEYVELGTPTGDPLEDQTGMPRDHAGASGYRLIPPFGTVTINLDAGPVVNHGSNIVGFPATAHGLWWKTCNGIRIAGTTNYDGEYELSSLTTVDQLVVTNTTFVSETLTGGGAETAAASIPQVTDLDDGRVQLGSPLVGRLTLDLERLTNKDAVSLDARGAYAFLLNARDRAETAAIEDTAAGTSDITWVGDNGERAEVFSLAIAPGKDMSYREALGRLLRSYFMWSADGASVAGTPKYRMGQFHAPAAGGTEWHGRLVTSEIIRELSAEPRAWRLTADFRPNHSPITSTPAGIAAAEQERLAAPYSTVEVARDEQARTGFDAARDIVWKTQFWDAEVAAIVGQRIWDFVSVERRWRTWEMALLPDEIETGEDFTVEGGSQDELAPSADVHFFPASIEDGITSRGVVLIGIS